MPIDSQGGKALAHVRHPGGKPDPRVGRNRDHAVRPRISRASASGSWLPLIRIRCPPTRSISMWFYEANIGRVTGTSLTISTGRKRNPVSSAPAPGRYLGSRSHLKIRFAVTV